ncbi:hypothetical protein [Thalassoglobus polymorphus]|uniref:Uncharacterized protein n=1 Tax=Thalassoglobus polymorphus TaxID=2527994 RepID=A0A517QUH3_9PLAN|nr:hypothetical protein [Thalassoglobus polymorphus]QDT35253.1 hypothetical protein Mal48_45290 [Thalassoglobus polymorphus]
MSFDVSWLWHTGSGSSGGDYAGTDEDVRHHYYKDGQWVAGYRSPGEGDRFESNTYTEGTFYGAAYDLRQADQIKITITNNGTHNPNWYPEYVFFQVGDDILGAWAATIRTWIRHDEWTQYALYDAYDFVNASEELKEMVAKLSGLRGKTNTEIEDSPADLQ